MGEGPALALDNPRGPLRSFVLSALLLLSTSASAGGIGYNAVVSNLGCRSVSNAPKELVPGTTVTLQVLDATRLKALGLPTGQNEAVTAVITDASHFKVSTSKGVTVQLVVDAKGNVTRDASQ
jgi:hypothetical protein